MKEKGRILVGGLILVTLGVLILLDTMKLYLFSRSWPLLLIVISTGTLIQRVKDIGGWFVGAVGIMFFLIYNNVIDSGELVKYILPVILILVGLLIFFRKFSKT